MSEFSPFTSKRNSLNFQCKSELPVSNQSSLPACVYQCVPHFEFRIKKNCACANQLPQELHFSSRGNERQLPTACGLGAVKNTLDN